MRRILTLAAMVGALVLPGAALASVNSTCESYNEQLCQVPGTSDSGNGSANTDAQASTTSTTATSAGTLPFTGLDVGLLLVGGGVLLGGGLLVRRLSRDSQ
jgi:hypothetical protein